MQAIRTSRTRGAALVSVLLVILLLTIIGVGIAYFAQVEDKISGNDQIQAQGFYAAEAGLRNGEKLISDAIGQPGNTFTTLLAVSAANGSYNPPGGGLTAYPLTVTYTDPSTGVVTNVTYTNQLVVPGDATRGSYSLYIRNNVEDNSGATTDSDAAMTLIAVGKAPAPSGIERVIEEKLVPATTASVNAGTQQGGGPGGTNTVTN